MANIGELVAAIRADTSQLERALRDSRQNITAFSSHAGDSFRTVETAVQKTENSVLSFKQAFVGTIGALGLWRAAHAITGWVKLSMAQEQAERGLKQVMVSMKRYSNETYDAMLKQASAMQKLTGIGDEMILSGQKMLMTFKQIPDDMIPRTTKAMLDLAALMGGNVNQAALQLGKAAMGLTGELRRVGITVDQQTYRLEGFEGVLRQIEEQVGGQAVAVAQGSGQWRRLGAAIGDAGEGLGKFFTQLAQDTGILQASTTALERFGDAMKNIVSYEEYQKQIPSYMTEDYLKKQLSRVQAEIELLEQQSVFREAWLVKGDTAKALQAFREQVKWLEEQIAIANERNTKSFEKLSESILDSMDPLKDLKKTLEETGKIKPLGENFLDPKFQAARKEVLDIIDKYTMSDADLKVKALNEHFARLRSILGDMPELNEAYRLSLEAINKQFEKIPEAIEMGLSLASGRLSEFSTAYGTAGLSSYFGYNALAERKELGFSGFSSLLDFDVDAVERKSEEAINKIHETARSRWDDFSDYAGNAFINAMTDGSDDWLKYLSREFKRTFLQETIGTQMKSLMSDIFGEKGFLQTTTLGKMFDIKGKLSGVALGDILGAGALGYGMGGLGGGLGAAGGYMLGMATDLGGPVGMIGGGLLGGLLSGGGLFGDNGPNKYQIMLDQINEQWEQRQIELSQNISNTLRDAISEGFKAGYESQGYQSFIDSFKADLGQDITDAFSQIMATKAIEPIMDLFENAFTKIGQYIDPETLIAKSWVMKETEGWTQQAIRSDWATAYSVMKETEGWTQQAIWEKYPKFRYEYDNVMHTGAQWLELYNRSQMGLGEIAGAFPSSEAFQTALDEMKPTFETVNEYLDLVKEALGLNTEALGQNTDALIGPVESFLRELTTGALAPAMSMEGIQAFYDKLYNQTMTTPQDFSSWVSGGARPYLDIMGTLGGYGQAVEKVKQDIFSLPWIQPGSSQFNIKVYLSGKEIAAEVVTEIENSSELSRQL